MCVGSAAGVEHEDDSDISDQDAQEFDMDAPEEPEPAEEAPRHAWEVGDAGYQEHIVFCFVLGIV